MRLYGEGASSTRPIHNRVVCTTSNGAIVAAQCCTLYYVTSTVQKVYIALLNTTHAHMSFAPYEKGCAACHEMYSLRGRPT